MMNKQTLKGWMAAALVICLLMVSITSAAIAEEAAAAEPAKNPVLQVIEHLKTVNWQELPQELKERIDAAGWQELQEKLKNFDWRGVLESIKSFFTETEWGELGQEIERKFQSLIEKGAEGWNSIEEYLSQIPLDDFVHTLEDAANQAARTVQGWAEQAQTWAEEAGSAVTDAVDTIQDAVTGLLENLGIF